MSASRNPMDRLLRKLGSRVALNATDREAILALPHVVRSYASPTYVVREGEPPRPHCDFILSGFAFRQKLTMEGTRQIVSLHMAGDFLDLQHLFLDIADHSVQALTQLETVAIESAALAQLLLQRPNVARAMWIEALVDSSIYREWVMNVGRRTARTRIAHLLCEFSLRLTAAGLDSDGCFVLPMTQEQLADAVGLTPVHVNRTLRDLTRDGLVERERRTIRFRDWDSMVKAGDFNPLYLHLDQRAPVAAVAA